jgi:hypothetical protein
MAKNNEDKQEREKLENVYANADADAEEDSTPQKPELTPEEAMKEVDAMAEFVNEEAYYASLERAPDGETDEEAAIRRKKLYDYQKRIAIEREAGGKRVGRPSGITVPILEFVSHNWEVMPDIDAARILGVTPMFVRKVRVKLGLLKPNGMKGGTKKAKTENPLAYRGMEYSPTSPPKQLVEEEEYVAMDELERAEFFRVSLQNSLFYTNLKEQFTKAEINFYLAEWGALCVQFEDIIATEKRQIDEFIKAEIMAARLLKNIRLVEDEIESLAKEIDALRATHDMKDDEEAQERDDCIINLIARLASSSQMMTTDYKKNQEMRNSILENLNARRRDRIDSISKSGNTFIGLVEAFRDDSVRKAQGKHMELVRLATQKKADDWRDVHNFPDGGKGVFLLDDKTINNQKSKELLEKLLEDPENTPPTPEIPTKTKEASKTEKE